MPLEGKDGWGSSAPEISGVFVDVGDVGVFSLDLSVNSEASDECNISDRRFEARKKHFETNLGITSEMTSGITSINPSPLLGPRCWQGPKSRARSLGEHRLESFSGFFQTFWTEADLEMPARSAPQLSSWSPANAACHVLCRWKNVMQKQMPELIWTPTDSTRWRSCASLNCMQIQGSLILLRIVCIQERCRSFNQGLLESEKIPWIQC